MDGKLSRGWKPIALLAGLMAAGLSGCMSASSNGLDDSAIPYYGPRGANTTPNVMPPGYGIGSGAPEPAAGAIDYSAIHSGQAFFYQADAEGNCGFDVSNDLMVVAINGVDYDNAAACGAYMRVSGPNGSVVVAVVDRCPECKASDIDLSEHAFSQIADASEGVVQVNWQYCQSPVGGPLRYQLKTGSNTTWTAVQILNHRHPIDRVELKRLKGTWRKLVRQPYNYWVYETGLGAGPWAIRVTDVFGQVVEEPSVQLLAGAVVGGSVQFPEVAGKPPVHMGNTDDPTAAPDEPALPAHPDGLEVTYTENDEWEGGYCAALMVENPTDQDVVWYTDLPFAGTLEKVWNCAYLIQGDIITLTGLAHNETIAAGSYTECGFCTQL